MAVLAEAEEGEAETAGAGDGALVAQALRAEIGSGAVGDVRVRLVDVDVREEMLLHVRAVAAGVLARDADVFIEVERGDVAAGALINDARVHADRRAARWQSENELRILADRFDEQPCGVRRQLVVRRKLAPLHATSCPRT